MRLTSTAIATVLALFLTLGATTESTAAPAAKAFGELPVGYDAAISPNGKELAIIVNVKGTYGIITQKVDSSTQKPWFVTLGDEVKPNYIKWVNNCLLYTSPSPRDRG